MSTWEEVQLKDIVSILGDGLHGTPEYSEDGEYYFVNGNNLNEGSITINQETQKVSYSNSPDSLLNGFTRLSGLTVSGSSYFFKVSSTPDFDHKILSTAESGFEAQNLLKFCPEHCYSEYLKYKKELSDRTLLVSINGTLGNVAYYQGEKVLLGKSACYFNLLDDVDKGFIRYILSTPYFQKYIQTYANGTTIKNLSLKAMREFSFNLPPLQEQKQVANILSCLDRKISNLRQQNETLERIAQTLFKHWFVDLEFPNEDGKPYKSSGGEMVRSELGEIPVSWRVGTFEEFFNLFSGGTPKTSVSEYWNGDVKWLSGKDVTSHHKNFILETEKTISTLGSNNSAAKLLPRYTTIISAIAFPNLLRYSNNNG